MKPSRKVVFLLSLPSILGYAMLLAQLSGLEIIEETQVSFKLFWSLCFLGPLATYVANLISGGENHSFLASLCYVARILWLPIGMLGIILTPVMFTPLTLTDDGANELLEHDLNIFPQELSRTEVKVLHSLKFRNPGEGGYILHASIPTNSIGEIEARLRAFGEGRGCTCKEKGEVGAPVEWCMGASAGFRAKAHWWKPQTLPIPRVFLIQFWKPAQTAAIGKEEPFLLGERWIALSESNGEIYLLDVHARTGPIPF